MKIQLPDFVLVDLYKNSLVVTGEHMMQQQPPAVTTEAATAAESWFLGGNNKQVTIVLNDRKQRYTDEESLKLLTNMLSALQLTLQDVAVINLNATPVDYKEILAQLQPRVCLMFDVSTQDVQLPFLMPDYKVQNFSNCKFLCSAALHKMIGNSKEARVEKTKLWMSLKTIFE